MSFSYLLNTNIGKIRLIISDKIISDPVFTDEEIQYFLTQNSDNINLAAATALEAWAAQYGANASGEKIGDYSFTQDVIARMLALAKNLRDIEAGIVATANATPALGWATLDLINDTETESEA